MPCSFSESALEGSSSCQRAFSRAGLSGIRLRLSWCDLKLERLASVAQLIGPAGEKDAGGVRRLPRDGAGHFFAADTAGSRGSGFPSLAVGIDDAEDAVGGWRVAPSKSPSPAGGVVSSVTGSQCRRCLRRHRRPSIRLPRRRASTSVRRPRRSR